MEILNSYDKGKISEMTSSNLERLNNKFKHSVIIKCFYPEMDYFTNWCWKQFGDKYGTCYEYSSEFPSCEFVLATEKLIECTLMDENKVETKSFYKSYSNPFDHSHLGNWSKLPLIKTGYDEGIIQYFFDNEDKLLKFQDMISKSSLEDICNLLD